MQRYLTARSIDEARHSLLMSAFVKIPLQLLILGTGVLVFVFYTLQTPPMLFNRVHDAEMQLRAARRQSTRHCSRSSAQEIAARRQAATSVNINAFLESDAKVRGSAGAGRRRS